MPFVKLDCGIIHSSLWAESSDTKICWITLLLLADPTGFVRAAPSAIAREAGIPAEIARQALDLFASPDNESRSPENQGKRIEKVESGYRVLNYEKYRERDYTNSERQKRWRENQKRNVTSVTPALQSVTRNASRSRVQMQSTDADKEKKDRGANGKPSRPRSMDGLTDSEWLERLANDPTYKDLDVKRIHGKMANWCKVNSKTPTRRRFINWLNKEEKPMRVAEKHEKFLKAKDVTST